MAGGYRLVTPADRVAACPPLIECVEMSAGWAGCLRCGDLDPAVAASQAQPRGLLDLLARVSLGSAEPHSLGPPNMISSQLGTEARPRVFLTGRRRGSSGWGSSSRAAASAASSM